jgi:hypothetical protein
MKKKWIYKRLCNADLFRKSMVNMGIKLYNKLPYHIKTGHDKYLFRELRSFLFQHPFYLVDEFMSY